MDTGRVEHTFMVALPETTDSYHAVLKMNSHLRHIQRLNWLAPVAAIMIVAMIICSFLERQPLILAFGGTGLILFIAVAIIETYRVILAHRVVEEVARYKTYRLITEYDVSLQFSIFVRWADSAAQCGNDAEALRLIHEITDRYRLGIPAPREIAELRALAHN